MRILLPLLLCIWISPSLLHAQPQTLPGARAAMFVENRGQWDRQARFLCRSSGLDLWVTDSGAVYDLYRSEVDGSEVDRRPPSDGETSRRRVGHVVRMTFRGARDDAEPFMYERQPGVYNYLIGNDRSRWATDVRSYRTVGISGLYDGVDLQFELQDDRPRYDLIVQPGADPRRIAMEFDGATGVRVVDDGLLEIETGAGTLRQGGLFTYQMVAGKRQQVECSFALREDGAVGFAIGAYDRTKPLVIDPLVYATYLGGSDYDRGEGIAVDADRNVYVCGIAESTAFPTTTGAYDTTHNGGFGDLFVTKVKAGGSTLVYSTFIGGNDNDHAKSIAINASGDVYVTGYTSSNDFPVTVTGFDTTLGFNTDAFVLKLGSTGNTLLYSTYLGGSDYDAGWGVAVDSGGIAYVVGSTRSSGFPTTADAYDRSHNQGRDIFVTKMNPTGSALLYSTFIGGGSDDYGNAIAVDGSGNAYITGMTASTNYPTTSTAYDKSSNGDWDLCLTKLAADGGSLVYSTYIGGSKAEDAQSIAVDAKGAAYLTGRTLSSDYPVTAGAYDRSYNGSLYDVFVTKVLPSGGGLAYSTFLGGGYSDMGTGIAVDVDGNSYVGGTVSSLDFPTTSDAYSSVRADTMDFFIAKFDSAGGTLLYSTYLGGRSEEEGGGIALDMNDDVYMTGSSRSLNFPVTGSAYDVSYNGGSDAVVIEFRLTASEPSIQLLSPNGGESFCPGTPDTIRWSSVGVTSVTIDLSYNDGVSYSFALHGLAPASDGFWIWHIPPGQSPASTYRIRVRDTKNFLFADSSSGSFTINAPTKISSNPIGGTFCRGDTLRLEVQAAGVGLGYQWRKNGTAIDGATSATFRIDSLVSDDGGIYTVVVTGACTPVVSDSAIVKIDVPPEITEQPSEVALCGGERAVFSVRADGSGLTYQWRKNGQAIPGADRAVFTIPAVTDADDGIYDVVLGGSCGAEAVSDSVRLAVDLPLSITSGPGDVTLCRNDGLTLRVSAVGSSLGYRWRRNGTDLPVVDSVFHLDVASVADTGTYEVIVSSPCSGADTLSAVVRLGEPPSIVVHPVGRVVIAGDSVSFRVTAQGSSLAYQWRRDGVAIPGATDSVYFIPAATSADGGRYTVVVRGACDPADTSVGAVLLVTTPTGVPGTADNSAHVGIRVTVVPNPAYGTTRLDIATGGAPLPRDARITLCDIVGRTVLDLGDRAVRDGHESVEFDADRLPSGLYFCRLAVGGETWVVGTVVVAR